jgi:glycosyltransferase involved in cell wall biosynthesis
MLEILLFGSVFLILFAYFGYPMSLILISLIVGKDVKSAQIQPTVTYIVTVHNEERRIKGKLDNVLELKYPRNNLQIIVASDGSFDLTNEIVREYQTQGVTLLELPIRQGKESAQREAVKHAIGEIIVFSDVATTMKEDGLLQIVSSFADPTVGCVSSEDRLLGRDGKPSGEGMYVRYEMWLRSLESKVKSLVGLSGSLFAARKVVCEDFSGDMQSDFRTVLNSVKLGLRGVSDPQAVGFYKDTADQNREWDRKIRTVVRGLTVFFRHLELLNIFKYGLFSYELFCHKLLRWLVPAFMILALLSNLALLQSARVYSLMLLIQISVYCSGCIGLLKPTMQDLIWVKIPTYYLAVNYSILLAWWRYLRGQRIVTWTPTRR